MTVQWTTPVDELSPDNPVGGAALPALVLSASRGHSLLVRGGADVSTHKTWTGDRAEEMARERDRSVPGIVEAGGAAVGTELRLGAEV